MKTTELIVIIIWIIVIIELFIYIITNISGKTKLLNHYPTYRYPYEESYFIVKNIEYIDIGICKYTLTVQFFKKENAKKWIYHKFYLYDKKDKYNIGDKLYLNKK